MNRAKGARVKKKWIFAIVCLLAITLGQCTEVEDTYFIRADPLIWLISSEQVKKGVAFVQINYKPVSPCMEQERSTLDWASEQNVKRTAYGGLDEECSGRYLNGVDQLAEAFAKCRMLGMLIQTHERENGWEQHDPTAQSVAHKDVVCSKTKRARWTDAHE